MNLVIILLASTWFIRIIRNLVSFIALWWIKEYRIDRMTIQFRTNTLRSIIFPVFRLPPITPKTVIIFILVSVSIFSFILFTQITLILKLLLIDLLLFPLIAIFVHGEGKTIRVTIL